MPHFDMLNLSLAYKYDKENCILCYVIKALPTSAVLKPALASLVKIRKCF